MALSLTEGAPHEQELAYALRLMKPGERASIRRFILAIEKSLFWSAPGTEKLNDAAECALRLLQTQKACEQVLKKIGRK